MLYFVSRNLPACQFQFGSREEQLEVKAETNAYNKDKLKLLVLLIVVGILSRKNISPSFAEMIPADPS